MKIKEDSEHLLIFLFNLFILEFTGLPSLRQENLYVESDINTAHQKYMYDLLYEQQSLYDYYDSVFQSYYNGGSCMNVRREDLPFAYNLLNFEQLMTQFVSNEDRIQFANLRWYQYSNITDSSLHSR